MTSSVDILNFFIHSLLFNLETYTDRNLSFSRYEIAMIKRGEFLEDVVDRILNNIGIPYHNLTHIINFKGKNKGKGGILDFLIPHLKIAIECKNWNCLKYTVDVEKALEKMASRFLQVPPGWRKVLIISNPKWSGKAKQYLEAYGIEVYEIGTCLGATENPNTVHKVKDILTDILSLESVSSKGSRRVLSVLYSVLSEFSLHFSSNTLIFLFKLGEIRALLSSFR